MPTTRERFIATMARLLETQGYHATGLNQVVQESGAPKGSLYHHFPGGKEELAAEAIVEIGIATEERIRQALVGGGRAAVAVRNLALAIARGVAATDFAGGSAISTVGLEAPVTGDQLREACLEAYARWQVAVRERLVMDGMERSRAEPLAAFIIAAIEGAVILSRVSHSVEPLELVAAELSALVDRPGWAVRQVELEPEPEPELVEEEAPAQAEPPPPSPPPSQPTGLMSAITRRLSGQSPAPPPPEPSEPSRADSPEPLPREPLPPARRPPVPRSAGQAREQAPEGQRPEAAEPQSAPAREPERPAPPETPPAPARRREAPYYDPDVPGQGPSFLRRSSERSRGGPPATEGAAARERAAAEETAAAGEPPSPAGRDRSRPRSPLAESARQAEPESPRTTRRPEAASARRGRAAEPTPEEVAAGTAGAGTAGAEPAGAEPAGGGRGREGKHLAVFGASGRTGVHLVGQALAAGYEVTALVRDPSRLPMRHERLQVVKGDVRDLAAVSRTIEHVGAVLCALGPSPAAPRDTLVVGLSNIVSAMESGDVRRLVVLARMEAANGGEATGRSRSMASTLRRLIPGRGSDDWESAARVVRESDLDWTIVRAPKLIDGERTGFYLTGYLHLNAGSVVSRADVAEFMLRQVRDTTHVHELPMISY